jgi:hypothetical protein
LPIGLPVICREASTAGDRTKGKIVHSGKLDAMHLVQCDHWGGHFTLGTWAADHCGRYKAKNAWKTVSVENYKPKGIDPETKTKYKAAEYELSEWYELEAEENNWKSASEDESVGWFNKMKSPTIPSLACPQYEILLKGATPICPPVKNVTCGSMKKDNNKTKTGVLTVQGFRCDCCNARYSIEDWCKHAGGNKAEIHIEESQLNSYETKTLKSKQHEKKKVTLAKAAETIREIQKYVAAPRLDRSDISTYFEKNGEVNFFKNEYKK